jgi:hypothetical protein
VAKRASSRKCATTRTRGLMWEWLAPALVPGPTSCVRYGLGGLCGLLPPPQVGRPVTGSLLPGVPGGPSFGVCVCLSVCPKSGLRSFRPLKEQIEFECVTAPVKLQIGS